MLQGMYVGALTFLETTSSLHMLAVSMLALAGLHRRRQVFLFSFLTFLVGRYLLSLAFPLSHAVLLAIFTVFLSYVTSSTFSSEHRCMFRSLT